jgi:hypothetical protein
MKQPDRDTWRARAEPIVRRVLDETIGQPDSERRAALRAAYPFGERAMWAYKCWLAEIRRQLGRRKEPTRPRLVFPDEKLSAPVSAQDDRGVTIERDANGLPTRMTIACKGGGS